MADFGSKMTNIGAVGLRVGFGYGIGCFFSSSNVPKRGDFSPQSSGTSAPV